MNERNWKHIFSRVGLACAGFILISVFAQNLVTFICMNIGISLESMDVRLLLSSICMYVLAFPLTAALFQSIPYPKPKRIGETWSFGTWAVVFFICIGVMSAGNLIGRGFMLVFGTGTSQNAVDMVIQDSGFFMSAVIMVVIGPVVEEILIRKLVIDRILIFGEKTAVLVSGLLFGLIHGNFYQFFYAFALGVIFGYVYVRTGKLRSTIILHMLINFIGSILIMGLMEWMAMPGIAGLLGMMMLLCYEILFFGSSIAGIVLLILNWKKVRFYQTPYEWSAPPMTAGMRMGIVFGNFGMIFFLLVSVMEFALNF